MADEARNDRMNEPTPERQGVREPQPIEDMGTSPSHLDTRREFEAADLAQENEPRIDHGRSDDSVAGDHVGLLDRVRHAWDRMRHQE